MVSKRMVDRDGLQFEWRRSETRRYRGLEPAGRLPAPKVEAGTVFQSSPGHREAMHKQKEKHMKQKQIQSIPSALNAGTLILGGLTDLSTEIGVNIITATEVAQKKTDLVTACGNHEQAKQTRIACRSALVTAVDNARTYIRIVRDMLKILFGYVYSDRWTTLGYQDSLALPEDMDQIIAMLSATKSFFTNNPTLEVASLNATAAQAQVMLDAITAAQNALASQEMTVESMVNGRDDKAAALRKTISLVIRELSLRLEPMDPRWLRFGLNLPGAEETPDQVLGVKVTLLGPTAAALKWEASARAQYYRIWFKVHGAEGDYTAAGSPADLDFTIENLPANSQIDIVITAVNTGGASPVSEVITITTH
jgi:hypothetical protein